uniref:Hypotheticial protein n=1 Tax=Heterorhabditis bacteriophora TaxID=37862 RepID=A0A1I7X8B4_HETBA
MRIYILYCILIYSTVVKASY